MKSMKFSNIFLFISFLLVCHVQGQTEADYFNKAAKQYVNEDIPGTGQILAEGLEKFPQDPKLNALLEKLKKDQEEQEKKDQQNQEQQEEDQQEQDQQEQEQEQDSQEQEDGEGEEQTEEDGAEESDEMEDPRGEQSQEEEEPEDPSEMDSDLSDREKAMEELRQRLEEMNITPEQAAQILDAMNSNELQYIQQNRKKPTEQPKRGLPDW